MPKVSTANSVTIPPPVGGWNTKDPVSAMGEEYAVELENFFPGFGSVDLRNGYRVFATMTAGVGSQVRSLFEYVNAAGDRYLIGTADDENLYNLSAGGAGTDIGGAVNWKFEIAYVNFRGLVFIRPDFASIDVYTWNGAGAVAAAAFTGPGGDDKNLRLITSYHSRLFFVQGDAATLWYGSVDQITGALKSFDVSGQLRLGGKILFIGAISSPGAAISDYFVIITNMGEVVLYSGDSPDSANWSISSRYNIPAPVGDNSFFYWGNDLCVITTSGVSRISEVMASLPTGPTQAMTENISSAFTDLIGASTYQPFTCGIVYPKGKYLLINISYDYSSVVQLVMNTITGAWTKFTGQRARVWCLYNNELYFGDTLTAKVFKADNGYFDENPSSTATPQARTIKMRPAYNYFGDRTSVKQFTEARPLMYQSEGMQLTMDADIDYANTAATQVVTPDNADTAYKIYRPRVGLTGIGKSASIRIDQSVTTKRISIQAIEVTFNTGDIT